MMFSNRIKIGLMSTAIVWVSSSWLLACGPTPPSPLVYPTSTTTNPNTPTAQPNTPEPTPPVTNPPNEPEVPVTGTPTTNDPNATDPNKATNPNAPVAFFAMLASDPNSLALIVASDPLYCAHLTAGEVLKSSTQTAVEVVNAKRGRFVVPTTASVGSIAYDDTCIETDDSALTGTVTITALTTSACAGSLTAVTSTGTLKSTFKATLCPVLAQADGFPFGAPSTHALSCQ